MSSSNRMLEPAGIVALLILLASPSNQETSVTINGPDSPVTIGSEVTLTCTAKVTGSTLNSPNRLQNLTFKKRDEDSFGSQDNPQIISINSVQKRDEGEYVCAVVASQKGGTATTSYHLKVTAPVRLHNISIDTSRTIVIQYPLNDFHIILLVSGYITGEYNVTAPPDMTLTVQHTTDLTGDFSRYKLSPVESPTAASNDDGNLVTEDKINTCADLQRASGVYSFWFENHPINVTFELDVQYAATWRGDNTNMKANIGTTDIHITCDVCANPEATYEWKLDSVYLNDKTRVISIPIVQFEHLGQYQCTATNTISGKNYSRAFNISLSHKDYLKDTLGDHGAADLRSFGGSPKDYNLGIKIERGMDYDDNGGFGDGRGSNKGIGINKYGGVSSRFPPYVYAIGAGIILILVIALALFDRRRRTKKHTEESSNGNGRLSRIRKSGCERTVQTDDKSALADHKKASHMDVLPNEDPTSNHVILPVEAPSDNTETSNKRHVSQVVYAELDFSANSSPNSHRSQTAWVRPEEDHIDYAEIIGTQTSL